MWGWWFKQTPCGGVMQGQLMRGIIDQIEVDQEGQAVVVEHKTRRNPSLPGDAQTKTALLQVPFLFCTFEPLVLTFGCPLTIRSTVAFPSSFPSLCTRKSVLHFPFSLLPGAHFRCSPSLILSLHSFPSSFPFLIAETGVLPCSRLAMYRCR